MNPTIETDSPTNVPKPDMSPESFDILLIEDDVIQSTILVEFLALLRYRVRIASTGKQAIEAAVKSVPDLVLLDIHLPDIDGLELLRKLREIDPQLAVVAISADTSADLLLKTLARGAEEFLQKPLVFSEMAIRLENVLTVVSFRRQSLALRKILETEKEMLSRYFPADAIDAILNSQDEHHLAPTVASATVLAFDLRNSTLLVETLGAATYASVLNSVMADLLDFVTSDGGNVVRLTGDGFIASFADPLGAGIKGALSCAERISVYFCNLRIAKPG
ncbi:MAG: response regulator, partial [Leptospirales bacterium]|nr:response regulator [Leptospirales bacterium]